MSTQRCAGRVGTTCGFIKAHRGQYPVEPLCRGLGVAATGYYGVASAAAVTARTRGRPTTLSHPRAVRGEPGRLRRSPRLLGLREARETCLCRVGCRGRPSTIVAGLR